MRRGGSVRLIAAMLTLACTSLVACGRSGSTEEAVASTAVEATTIATERATTVPTTAATTIATSTIATSIATTAATTAIPAVLPQPAPAPDPYAAEPELEVGTIAIPKIGLVKPLFEGVSLTTLDRGPGHWPGSARPGQVGNVVIGGHRVSKERPFRNLDALVPGDQILLGADGVQHTYEVTGTQIVTPEDVWIIDPTPAKTATLFACHPPGSTRLRIVVFAKLAGT